jgi:hypothetical protein
MKIYEWKDGMPSDESKNGAYWERNTLALYFAIQTNIICKVSYLPLTCGWYFDTDNNWDGWKRVISLYNGKITFHIPDEFDIGSLEEIEPNWDGHTTIEKWSRIMKACSCKID